MAAPLTRIGRYEIIDKLGHGGMGTLYLARDPAIERLVAIKLLRDGLDNEELRERFAREARSAGKLRHPNVVTIFDVGEDGGLPFIAMEYIPGQTLAEVIRRREPLALTRKLQIVEDVCSGLEYAHKAGIVHRDIKPANIMVDPDDVVKILDFGIARIAQSGMTQSGMLVGTLNYMSPEQVGGTTVDQRSDVFAVGAVLYELVTYQQAFPGGIQDGIFNRILTGEPPSPGTIVPGVPPELERIIAQSLKKDAAQRYADLGVMRRDLARVRQGLESSAQASDATMPLKPVPGRKGTDTAPPITGRRGTDRALLAKRRAAQIDAHLATAREEFDAGRFEEAVAACEQAATLDPDDVRALDLMDRAKSAIEERQMLELVEEARQQLQRGAMTAANDLLDRAAAINHGNAQNRAVTEIQRVRLDLERARERAEQLRTGVQRARAALEQQAFETVMRHANELLAIDPGFAEAQELRRRAQQGLEERRRAEEHERRAAEVVVVARAEFARGRHADALARLRAFSPPHALVSAAIDELAHEAEEIRRREEEERRRAEAEAARRQAEEEAARKRAAEEAARRAEAEAARKRADEEAARKRAEQEAALRRAEQEVVRRRAEEEAARKRAEAEAARKRQADDEAARRRAQEVAAVAAAAAAAAPPDATVVRPTPPPALVDETVLRPPLPAVTPPLRETPRPPIMAPPPPKPREAVVPVTPSGAPSKSTASALVVPAALAALIVLAGTLAYVFWPGGGSTPDPMTPTSMAMNTTTSAPVDPVTTTPAPQVVVTTTSAVPPTSALTTTSAAAPAALAALRQGRDTAAVAATSAREANAPANAAETYRQALARERDAGRLAAAGRNEDATRAYQEAAELFGRAAEEARRAAAPTSTAAPSTVTSSLPPRRPIDPTPLTSSSIPVTSSIPPATSSVAAVSSSVPAVTPAPPAVDDDRAVREALARYQAAYERLDTAGVKALFPGMDARMVSTLAEAFRGYTSLSYAIAIESIQFSGDGSQATVNAVIAQRAVAKVGSVPPQRRRATFTLRKTGGAWIIINQRFN